MRDRWILSWQEFGLVDSCEAICLADKTVAKAFLRVGLLLDAELVMNLISEAFLMATTDTFLVLLEESLSLCLFTVDVLAY